MWGDGAECIHGKEKSSFQGFVGNVCSRFLEESSWEQPPVRLLVVGVVGQQESV